MIKRGFKQKWKRFAFWMGKRPILRDADRSMGIPIPRLIWKTGRVKGKRLVIKTAEEPRERIARQLIQEHYLTHASPKNYILKLSKRYPSIRGKRTEIYYDKPSLRDAIEINHNRRLRKLLSENRLNDRILQEKALEAFDELGRDLAFVEMAVSLDIGADQILIDKIDSQGKVHLILVDA